MLNLKLIMPIWAAINASQDGSSGRIVLRNYENDFNYVWSVESECDAVQITSSHFATEGCCDHLTIGEESYSGTVEISQIVPTSFTVAFSSDQSVTNTGFTLLWSCYEPVNEPVYDHIAIGTRCTSGNPFSNARVVQGIEAVPHSWPWIVSLQLGDFHFCGGTIVNAEWIVTAAHCCANQNPRRVTVVTGEHDFGSSSGVRVQSIEIHIHPDYSGGNDMANDICLIKTRPMNIDGMEAEAVCLPEQGVHITADDANNVPNTNCYIAGWGATESGASPDELQSARVNIFSAEYCADNTNMAASQFDPAAEFCAGYVSGGRDTCQGDSGGPLICVVNDRPTLYGITSWGYGCGDVGYPGVYAKVSPHINWFNQVINQVTIETTTTPPVTTTSDAPITVPVMTGTNGIIELNNYENNHDQEWVVNSECEAVLITSAHFATEEGYDHLTIGEESYSGAVEINQVVGGSFTVSFSSDHSMTNTGFFLRWSCYEDVEDVEDGENVDQLPAGLQCSGNAFSENRIIAGTDAAEHRWPFIFSLQRNNFHSCGGSILNEEWVMTAAHCCDGLDLNSGWKVVVGAHDHTALSPNEQRLNIKRVIIHPNFAHEGFIANDICLLNVDAMVLGSDVQVVCLPEQNELPVSGEGCFVGGWGATCNPEDPDCYPTQLQSVNNDILSDEQCSNSPVGGSFIGHAEMCAIKLENGNPVQGNACNGDSGGPLVCVVHGEARQYGVVSWGRQGCMLEGSPSVFAEVSSYISWMKTIIRNTQNPIGGRDGTIELRNYENNHDQEWVVNSECDAVHVTSTHFATEGGYDHLTIDEESYSGTVEISQIVASSFTVRFSSDQSVTATGFTLLWSCYEDGSITTTESTLTTTSITSTTTTTLDGKGILTITVDLGTAINYHSNLLIPGTAEYNDAVSTIMEIFNEALAQLATENGLSVDNTQVLFTDGSVTENRRKRRSVAENETADGTLSSATLSIPTNRIFKQRLHTTIQKWIKKSNHLSYI